MRRISLCSLASLALMAALPAQPAKGPSGGKQVDTLMPHQKAFSNIPEEQRRAFFKHHQEAARLFAQKRIFETLEAVKLAENIFKDSAELYNLKGSCYVELRAFDKALTCFQNASELSPNNYSILFNIGEVHFVTREWQKAYDSFSSLLKTLPKERKDLNRISEFKLLLCSLKLGKDQEFKTLAEKYDYLDDSPYHYFAKAVIYYEKEEHGEAERWIARAGRIFRNPAIMAPWQDTMVEFGYIKSFYGGDNQ